MLLCCGVIVKGDTRLPSFILCEVSAVRKPRIETHLSCEEWEGAAEPMVSTADMLEKYPCILSCLSFKECGGGGGRDRVEEISSTYKEINKRTPNCKSQENGWASYAYISEEGRGMVEEDFGGLISLT